MTAPEFSRVLKELTRELADQGAEAVVLLGSHARGDAHPLSDVDVHAIGHGPSYMLERRAERLISISWLLLEEEHERLRDPATVGVAAPGWRSAVILHDPIGVATTLQAEAREWTWESVGDARCDAYVADGVTGLAEEVYKLVASLQTGSTWTAAVQRSVLALRLPVYLAVHHRILYETENRLWDLVAARMGERWARAQGKGFGLGGEGFTETCYASLELYALAASEVLHLLDARRRAVVAGACAVAGRPLS